VNESEQNEAHDLSGMDSLDYLRGETSMSTEEKEQKKLSRREFVKGAAIGAAGVAAGGVLASCGATPTPETVIVKETVEVPKEVIKEVTKEVIKEVNPLIPQKWDYEADVVILGLGLAGAAAAIEAYDKGAKVLVVEKQPHDTHYSNSRMSGGVWHNPHPDGDRNARVEYVQAMMCGVNIPWKIEGEQPHVSRPMAEMFADRMMDNERWLKSMDPELVVDPPAGVASFPTFPFFNEAKYGATVGNRYPDSTNANPDQLAPQRPKLQKASGESMMWAVIEEGIRKKRPAIEILYSTPARRIVQNTNGEIIGVIAEQGGKEIACKAKRAVVVCTGGYEYNVAMRRAFLKGPGVKGWCFYGSPDNTGDGIEMASRVGAGLAKVMKAASRIEIAVPYGRGYDETGLKMGLISTGQAAKNGFMVDNDGKRYADEHKIIDSRRPYRYQFYEEAVHYDMLNMRYPRVPTWLIFDEREPAKLVYPHKSQHQHRRIWIRPLVCRQYGRHQQGLDLEGRYPCRTCGQNPG